MPVLPITIRFGSIGDFKLWSGEGWSIEASDKEHTWMDGYVAKLRLMLEYAKGDRLLELDLIPYRPNGIEQELFFYLNGGFVAYWRLREAGTKTTRIEAGLFNSGENVMSFVAPRAVCPAEIGQGQDQRVLGIAFKSILLTDT